MPQTMARVTAFALLCLAMLIIGFLHHKPSATTLVFAFCGIENHRVHSTFLLHLHDA